MAPVALRVRSMSPGVRAFAGSDGLGNTGLDQLAPAL